MKRAPASAVVLTWLALASPAVALEADPFEIGDPGEEPSVAVDNKGAAHFVWNERRAGLADVTHYCKVLPGASECKITRRFAPRGSDPADNTDPDGPRVLVRKRTVIVVTHRCCGGFGPSPSDGLFARRSVNRGRTFGSPQLVGNGSMAGDAIRGPFGGFSTISDDVAGGTFFQAHRSGAFAAQSANLGDADPDAQVNSGSLALLEDDNVLATFADQVTTFWRRYTGSGNPNDVANWTPATPVGLGVEGRLAGGPNGAWLLYRVGDAGSRQLVAREFTGSDFGSETTVSEPGSPLSPDFFQAAAGRLHAVWLGEDRSILYRRSDDTKTFGRTTQMIGPSGDKNNLEVAAGEDGNGWVTWDEGRPDGRIRAAALHVDPEPPVIGKTVTATVVKGEVLIKLPGGSSAAHASQDKGQEFVPLSVVGSIPVKSIVDTTDGKVKISSRRKKGGKKQRGTFSAGVFQVLQSRKAKKKGLTELRLKGSIAEHCKGGKKSASAAKLSKKAIRRLKAKAKGRYRTRGRHSAATVRGTKWTITDRCDGTLTKVKRGKVTVRDFRLKKTIVVKRGKRYLAKAKG
jgi:hypothetical protein